MIGFYAVSRIERDFSCGSLLIYYPSMQFMVLCKMYSMIWNCHNFFFSNRPNCYLAQDKNKMKILWFSHHLPMSVKIIWTHHVNFPLLHAYFMDVTRAYLPYHFFMQGLMQHHEEIVKYFNTKGVYTIFLFRRNLLRRMISILANSYDQDAKLLNRMHKSHVHSPHEVSLSLGQVILCVSIPWIFDAVSGRNTCKTYY